MSFNYQETEEERLFSAACRRGDLETVKLLSRHVNAIDYHSTLYFRPLHHAAEFVHEHYDNVAYICTLNGLYVFLPHIFPYFLLKVYTCDCSVHVQERVYSSV